LYATPGAPEWRAIEHIKWQFLKPAIKRTAAKTGLVLCLVVIVGTAMAYPVFVERKACKNLKKAAIYQHYVPEVFLLQH
jgi:hypothetical protein